MYEVLANCLSVSSQSVISQPDHDPGYNDRHWRMLKHRLLWAYRARKDPAEGHKPAPVNLAPSATWLVLNGSCRVEQDQREFVASAGQWVIPKPGRREQFFAAGTEILSVAFMARWPQGEDLLDIAETQICENQARWGIQTLAEELVSAVNDAVGHHCGWADSRRWPENLTFSQHAAIEGCFFRWLARFTEVIVEEGRARMRGFGTNDERVSDWIEQMESWPLGKPFSPEELAREAGLSRRRVDELFHDAMGKTAQAYFDDLLLARLSSMLSDETLQIKQIAYEAGFEYPSNFARWFRRMTGMTPAEYRIAHSG